MFRVVWRCFLLVVIVWQCILHSESGPQPNSANNISFDRDTLLLVFKPRYYVCQPKRFKSTKLYLAILLLLTSGDIELNPGPTPPTSGFSQHDSPPLLDSPQSSVARQPSQPSGPAAASPSGHTAAASQPVREPPSGANSTRLYYSQPAHSGNFCDLA